MPAHAHYCHAIIATISLMLMLSLYAIIAAFRQMPCHAVATYATSVSPLAPLSAPGSPPAFAAFVTMPLYYFRHISLSSMLAHIALSAASYIFIAAFVTGFLTFFY